MKKQKSLLTSALCLFLAGVFLAALPTEAEAKIYDDTVRLHILAASDSDADQEVKLAVRDALLDAFGERLSEAGSPEEAKQISSALLPEMTALADRVLAERGFSYRSSVTLTDETYPTRCYGDLSMPGGRYLSLRVVLDGGEGHNWWCVMFPPLCTSAASEKAEEFYSFSERELIERGEVRIKFKLLEVLSSIGGENS